MSPPISRKLGDRCRSCGFCELYIACQRETKCSGCGACVAACPHSAKTLEEIIEDRKTVKVKINGESCEVFERITILGALELLGLEIGRLPGEGDISAPCRTGGCWECAVLANGELRPGCITPVEGNMEIETGWRETKLEPLRLVSGFQGHTVGGVGTPYWLKPRLIYRYIETACFAHGCILRCPTCQNWEITYSSTEQPLTPAQAAKLMTGARREFGVNRMAISGGEPTLNRKWLLEYFRELRELNSDDKARLHLDTNAVVLSHDYVDELVDAGMTDVGVDVKGLELATFMRITGIIDEALARKLHANEWEAVEYLLDEYRQEVFIGIGIPYNTKLISLEETGRLGERIAGLEPEVQVCALDYRPEFRCRHIRKPRHEEMVEVKRTLEGAGLRSVICQTERGHLGPEHA